ncbi:hypothetical protein V1477_019208 [Vespula maculifrons]|uniref:Uncharacterized protein n=1 Tax=Vespula maculifrons TaxID=7453 RepID=A0ABD2ARW8_VESMC
MYVPISKWDTRYMPKIYWHFVWGALLRNAETAVAMLGGTPSREYKDTIEYTSSNGSGGVVVVIVLTVIPEVMKPRPSKSKLRRELLSVFGFGSGNGDGDGDVKIVVVPVAHSRPMLNADALDTAVATTRYINYYWVTTRWALVVPRKSFSSRLVTHKREFVRWLYFKIKMLMLDQI